MRSLPTNENNSTAEQGPEFSQRVIEDQIKGQIVEFH